MPDLFRIIETKQDPDDTTNDFVAIGNAVQSHNNMLSYHAGFIIKYSDEYYQFDFNNGIELEEFDETLEEYWYHVRTETVPADDVPAFIAMCQNIKKNANPKYGYFYSGESYDVNGVHQSTVDLGERMTCVGFCINVLKGFLEEDYLVYTDWAMNSKPDADEYLKKFYERTGLDPDKVAPSIRRITPRECLASCYFSNLPIRKAQIDSIMPTVDTYFDNKSPRPAP